MTVVRPDSTVVKNGPVVVSEGRLERRGREQEDSCVVGLIRKNLHSVKYSEETRRTVKFQGCYRGYWDVLVQW